jgi:transcriptional accessory protein Tex/SPT6
MKRIFIHFEANKTGFIRIEANQRILHAKRINGREYSLLGEYFQKEPNII